MIIDLNKSRPAPRIAAYDVCICGAGVAGITLAIELSRAGLKVALLEGGDKDYSEQSQSIYGASENIGRQYYGLTQCRLRYLGGTSNHWAGQCRPFSSVDFEERGIFGLPGWPIPKAELDRHLAAASAILDLGDQGFGDQAVAEWKSSAFGIPKFAYSPPTRFREKFGNELFKSDRIDLMLNANVTEIRLSKSLDHVSEIKVRSYAKDEFDFPARRFALCLGAVENARILLHSSSQIPAGLGNQSDFVGRCFMEHLSVDIGRFVAVNADFWNVRALPIAPTREYQLKHRIANGVISYIPKGEPETYGRLRHLKRFVRDNVCRSDTLTDVARRFAHFHCPDDGVIGSIAEQSPNRDSRITLSGERDALGMRKVKLNWQLNELDRRTVRTLALESAKELARLDLGRVQLDESMYNEKMDILTSHHCHQMGTTRMASSSQNGVVDKDCRVFGIDNLYVGGSSVFSTGGATNPTLPIVQLALRLSEHLKKSA